MHQHNNIFVLMLPQINSHGYLPPGVHQAPWAEVVSRFGLNSHRNRLLVGLYDALTSLAKAGCREVLLDGSFVSKKPLPDDYDGAWEPDGVDPDLLDPVLLDFSNGRAAMKAKFGGELFPASAEAGRGILYRDFFLTDRNGVCKGVIEIDPRSLS